jgi:aspartyl-tRNA(Asn)/glutamyl-tRNA(Gln) amidotransferase subunit A
MQTMALFPRYTRPISFLGLPALVMTGGFSAEGLPISFQFVAQPFAEATLLRIAHKYQHLTDWHDRLPPI